jgi:hypothetical protein
MKKIILITIILINSLFVKSQDINYPRIINDSSGSYVVFTLEQAYEMNKKLNILKIMEDYNLSYQEYDSISIKVINEKDEVISMQNLQINNLNENIKTKNDIIDNYKKQISIYNDKEKNYLKEIENKNSEIKLHLDKINKMKNNMLIGGTIGGIIITSISLLLIF